MNTSSMYSYTSSICHCISINGGLVLDTKCLGTWTLDVNFSRGNGRSTDYRSIVVPVYNFGTTFIMNVIVRAKYGKNLHLLTTWQIYIFVDVF
jgi:hypothetical protein